MLLQNWHGHATVPRAACIPINGAGIRPSSRSVCSTFRQCAPPRELLSLFGAQWADGRIPQIAFNPAVPDDAYFPGPSVWRSSAIEGHPPIDTSGIIQPPLHAVAAASILSRLGDRGLRFAERAYPCLVDQNAYIRRRRTVDGGLAALVHPWETGLDNSPAWDHPLAAVPADLTLFETYTRRDVAHAGVGERPTDEDYARYIRLMLMYRDHGYDDDWVRAEAEFLVVDPAFNALWAWSELALAESPFGSAEMRVRTSRKPHGSRRQWWTGCGAKIAGYFWPGTSGRIGSCPSVRWPGSSRWCCRVCRARWSPLWLRQPPARHSGSVRLTCTAFRAST